MRRPAIPLLFAAAAVLAAGRADAQKDKEKSYLQKSTTQWAGQLKSGDAAARRGAAFALGKLFNDPDRSLPALKAALPREADAKVREAIVEALGEVGMAALPPDGEAEALLAKAAGDPDKLVRRTAVWSLGRIGGKAAGSQAALARALSDGEPEVRQTAAWALGQLGDAPVAPLVKALGDPDALVRRDAAASIGALAQTRRNEARAALSPLLELCRDPDSETRKKVLFAVVKIIDAKDKRSAPILQQALGDQNVEARRYAALALSNVGGRAARDAVPILLETLRGAEVELQRDAAMALHNIGPDAAEATSELVRVLSHPDAQVRQFAALALGGIGTKAQDAIPHLVGLVVNADETLATRVEAAEALTNMQDVPPLRQAVPRLLPVLGNRSEKGELRLRVAWAFNHLTRHDAVMADAVPVMERVCAEPPTEENTGARWHCAYLVGGVKKDKAPEIVLDVLSEWLGDEKGKVYLNKQTNVGATGQEAASKSTVTENVQGDSRIIPVYTLGQIGPRRVRARGDITRQLGVLAGNTRLDAELLRNVRELLRQLQ